MLHIRTARLRLRPLTPSDAPALLRLYSDPEVVRFMHTSEATEAQERAKIDQHIERYYQTHGLGLLGGALDAEGENGELVGRYGLLRSQIGGASETEVSYITAPEHRGRGYAVEALNGLVDAAFALGIERLVAVILDENVASQRVAERAGFRFEKQVSYKEFGEVGLYVRPTSQPPTSSSTASTARQSS